MTASIGPGRYDAVVVGAGFAGMYSLLRLRELGFRSAVFEAADDVGGTWYWNRYPGARCDIESMDYSYSFSPELQQEWEWTERYATQPEILRYANHVADRFDLRRDIQFNTRVVGATYDERDGVWEVTTDCGDTVSAQFLIMAAGVLSTPKLPEIPGIESFAGATYHTANWPHAGVDLSGLRVGVIGTGSSGIQSIPLIAEQADHLTVFQRTPNFSSPALNAPLDPTFVAARKAGYEEYRKAARQSHIGVVIPHRDDLATAADPAEREENFRSGWTQGTLFGLASKYADVLIDPAANEYVAEFVRERIKEVVTDPDVATKLAPTSHPYGTKRPCLDTGYFETFNRDNVTLVDVREAPIVAVDAAGLRTSVAHYDLDALVFATGFDALTGPLFAINPVGVGGTTLREKWEHGPRTYLGLATAGFPNLFTITGPGSPSVLTNMMMSIEQHVEWITDCMGAMRDRGITTIEPQLDAEDFWVDHVNEVGNMTLYPKADSWYMGANVPGKPRVFLPYVGGLEIYRGICDDVADDDYRGFTMA